MGRVKNWSVSMRCFLSVDSSEKVKIKFPACSMLKLFTKNGNFITTSIISTKANNLTPPFDSYQKIMYKIKKNKKIEACKIQASCKITMWQFLVDMTPAPSMKAETHPITSNKKIKGNEKCNT